MNTELSGMKLPKVIPPPELTPMLPDSVVLFCPVACRVRSRGALPNPCALAVMLAW